MFTLSFENKTEKTGHTRYYLSAVEVKNYNVMIDGRNIFDQQVKNDIRTETNIWKTTAGNGDDYTTGYLMVHTQGKLYADRNRSE